MPKENCQELFTLTIEQFAQVIELGVPLEALFVMECIIQGTNPALHIKSQRLGGITQLLTRKNYLSKDGQITPLGRKFYDTLRCGGMELEIAVKEIKEQSNTSFEVWWKVFPASDGFEYMGQKFEKTRALRTGESVCRILFEKNATTTSYTAEQIIEATKTHIELVKRHSVKTKQNKLSFINNSQTYLRNRIYEAFVGEKVEAIKTEVRGSSPISTTVDI
jgi:hypothetical protein